MTALKKTHRKLRQGGYLAATTAIVVAIVVFLNLIVGQLPTHLLEFDLSDKQLYTVTDTSKEFLAGLDKDVEIVVLAEESNVDERIAKFLDNYAALSSHMSGAGTGKRCTVRTAIWRTAWMRWPGWPSPPAPTGSPVTTP